LREKMEERLKREASSGGEGGGVAGGGGFAGRMGGTGGGVEAARFELAGAVEAEFRNGKVAMTKILRSKAHWTEEVEGYGEWLRRRGCETEKEHGDKIREACEACVVRGGKPPTPQPPKPAGRKNKPGGGRPRGSKNKPKLAIVPID